MTDEKAPHPADPHQTPPPPRLPDPPIPNPPIPNAPVPNAPVPTTSARPPGGSPAVDGPGGSPASAPQVSTSPPARRGLPTGAIIGIAAGGAVVLVATVLVVVLAVTGGILSGARLAPARPDGAQTSDPGRAAEAYLQAIADSDAETALSLVDYLPDDKTLLSDEVLEKSNALAPLTDIVIGSVVRSDSYTAELPVSYRLGAKKVDITLEMSKSVSKGTWKVAWGDIGVASPYRTAGLDLFVNGVASSATTFRVFPGTYELTTDSPLHALTGTTTITVFDRSEYDTSFAGVDVTLTEAGAERFRTAITAAVDACLASTSLQADCGLALPESLADGTKIVDGTLKRTLSAEAAARMAHLEPESTAEGAFQMRSADLGKVDVTADCEVDGRRFSGCTFVSMPRLGSALVDLAVDPPVVRWS